MKKNYEKLLINVISLDSEDVIATSANPRGDTSLLDGLFDLGDLNVQDF